MGLRDGLNGQQTFRTREEALAAIKNKTLRSGLNGEDMETGKIGEDVLPPPAPPAPDAPAAPASPEAEKSSPEFDRQRIISLMLEGTKKPKDNPTLLEHQNAILSPGGVADKSISKYETAIRNLDADIKAQMQEKRDTADRSDLMALSEQLSNAILMYGAGQYGMAHGVDMSGTKFNKTDWDRKLANRLGLINEELTAKRGERREAVDELGAAHKGALTSAKEQFQAGERNVDDYQKQVMDARKLAIHAELSDAVARRREATDTARKLEDMKKVDNKLATTLGLMDIKSRDKEIDAVEDAISLLENKELDDTKAKQQASESTRNIKKGHLPDMSKMTEEEKAKLPKQGFFESIFSSGQDRQAMLNAFKRQRDVMSANRELVGKSLLHGTQTTPTTVAPTPAPVAAPAAPEVAKPPHGPSVVQDGIKYIWNGSEYVAEK